MIFIEEEPFTSEKVFFCLVLLTIVLIMLYMFFSLYFFVRSLSWRKYLKKEYPDFCSPLILLESPERSWANIFQPFRLLIFPTEEMKIDPRYLKLMSDPRFRKQKTLLIINLCWLGVTNVLLIMVAIIGLTSNL